MAPANDREFTNLIILSNVISRCVGVRTAYWVTNGAAQAAVPFTVRRQPLARRDATQACRSGDVPSRLGEQRTSKFVHPGTAVALLLSRCTALVRHGKRQRETNGSGADNLDSQLYFSRGVSILTIVYQ